MSIEVGVVLAWLMDRVLVLDGDVSPPANVVDYGARVSNARPSRVSDLIDFPVPWIPSNRIDLSGLDDLELMSDRQMGAVFVHPPSLETATEDFRAFARGREEILRDDERVRRATVVRMSGGPPDAEAGNRLSNLCFYSYFFYLDTRTKHAVHRLLRAMTPKAPYRALASRIAADVGPMNCVHIRRGDFKRTIGTTTRDRRPEEVIALLDQHFERDQKLAIATDEMDDPFFEPILAHFGEAFFLDALVLDEYGEAFRALPQHDSIALAFLSQLVAAESEDFIGSMSSTYTSIIQRYRGNAGRPERFKFLWNEIPDPGVALERGSHAPSDCIPLDRGIMVEEFSGPYSWNRYNPRLNPAWMREWPEGILDPATREAGPPPATPPLTRDEPETRPPMPLRPPMPSMPSMNPTDREPPPPGAIRVEIALTGGQRHEVVLEKDSDLLRRLFEALAAAAQPPPRPDPTYFEIPLENGRVALSFPSTHLVSIVTEPPVLIRS